MTVNNAALELHLPIKVACCVITSFFFVLRAQTLGVGFKSRVICVLLSLNISVNRVVNGFFFLESCRIRHTEKMSDKVCQNGNGTAAKPLTNGIANGVDEKNEEKIAGVFYNAKEASW